MNNSGIPFVNVQEDVSTSQTEVLNEDPFAGVGVEEKKPQFYQIENKVFAEPLHTPNEILNISSDFNVERTYYDQFAVRQFPGRRNKRYNLNINKDDLTCPQERCGKTFSKTMLLRAHIRRIHCKGPTKFECHLCAASFSTNHQLNRHMFVHSGDKKQCPVCRKVVSVRTALSAHLKSHGNQTFQCDLCSRILKSRKSMMEHLFFVHRPGHLKCNKCGRKFAKTIEYRHHRATHIERNIACELCGKMLPTLAALGVHKRIHEIHQNNGVQTPQSYAHREEHRV